MNGSPVGIPSSFLQPIEPLNHSSEKQGERGGGIFTPAKTPTTYANGIGASGFFPGLKSGKDINFKLLGLGALRKGGSMVRRKKSIDKDELSEDYCFVCKDGGEIRVCDFKACLKSYHPQCLQKDDSFLESDERWTCGWHSCYNCQKSSTFKCFCCPYSTCRVCIGGSDFVLVKGTKGFCNNCLSLTKLIEENAIVNSDGEVVDFDDTDTYEFLFKDYWEIVKEKEGLSMCILQAANDLLNRGEKSKNLSDLDENFEVQVEKSDDDCDNEDFPPKNLTRKQSMMKMMKEKSKSKKMTYIGWASKELIEFLTFLGKNTQLPLGQDDVCEIVKEYIQSNNLLRHNRKKKQQVFCDARLVSLFRRKKVNLFKVYSLLEKHLTENNDSDDESLSLEEDDFIKSVKKQRREKSPSKQSVVRDHFRQHALEPHKKCFAAITEANINLIYLKRSLIVELMKNPKTFENKAVGCFVRRECDPRDSYRKDSYGHRPPKTYQLNQITGVKKASEEYKIGELNTDIVLCVSNYWKVVQISMLSDDNFVEEECEDLRRLVKKGLFKRPSIEEMKEKIKTIHEDMVKHSVKKELLRLEKQIVRANEKGWRKELFDCIERKKLLSKPEEIMRLMKELPDVTADIEAEATEGGIQSAKPSVVSTKNNIISEGRNGAPESSLGNAAIFNSITAKEKHEVGSDTGVKALEGAPESFLGNAAKSDSIIANEKHEALEGVPESFLGNAAKSDPLIAKEKHEGGAPESSLANAAKSDPIIAKEKHEDGDPASSLGNAAKSDSIIAKEKHEGSDTGPSSTLIDAANSVKIVAEGNTEGGHESGVSKANAGRVVIEIDDEDETSNHNIPPNHVNRTQERAWNYKDLSGNVQGPFSLTTLKYWMEQGFFDEDFTIWRASESQANAIPLILALNKLIRS